MNFKRHHLFVMFGMAALAGLSSLSRAQTTSTVATTGTATEACSGDSETSGSATKAIYSNDFESLPEGPPPSDMLIQNGAYTIKVVDGNHVLHLPGKPLDTFGLLFGPSRKEDTAVSARVFSVGKKRIRPFFAIGLGGGRGYKLQVASNGEALALSKGDAPLANVPYRWKSGAWVHLKMQARKTGEGWRIEGKAWVEGEKEPAEWMVAADDAKAPSSLRGSLWGQPYAENPILYDTLEMSVPAAGASETSAPPAPATP